MWWMVWLVVEGLIAFVQSVSGGIIVMLTAVMAVTGGTLVMVVLDVVVNSSIDVFCVDIVV